MDEMFFELLCITITLYLKNLSFEKMANPNGLFPNVVDKSEWNVYSVFNILYNQYISVRMEYIKYKFDLIALD